MRAALEKSLAALGTTYLDLLLLHSVGPSPAARHEAWSELEALKREGLVRAIGVSNFGVRELKDLVSKATIKPAVNQVKFNVYHRGGTHNAQGDDLAEYAQQQGILLIGYCTLNDWPSKLKPVDDMHVASVARRLGRTPAQVLLQWSIQVGISPLTRSRSEARLAEAAELLSDETSFVLSVEDEEYLSGLAWWVHSSTYLPPSSTRDVHGVLGLPASAAEWAGRELKGEL